MKRLGIPTLTLSALSIVCLLYLVGCGPSTHAAAPPTLAALIGWLTSIGIGLLLAIPGVALGYWVQRSHAAPNRWVASVLFCVGTVLIKKIWLPSVPYDILALFAILASTMGVYRMDIYWAFKQHDSKR